MKLKYAFILCSAVIFLSGCNTAGSTIEPAAITAEAVAPKRGIGSFLSGPAGESLADTDRQLAYNAQIKAADSGKRSQWRAQKSDAYGYVEVLGERVPSQSKCKTYQHIIYIKGRSQRGNGEICQSDTGNWEVIN